MIFEVVVAISASNAKGFTRLWWTVATLVSGGIATFFLSLALLTFDIGVGYAIWTSVAGVGIVIVGSLFLGQRLSARKFLGIVIVIAGGRRTAAQRSSVTNHPAPGLAPDAPTAPRHHERTDL